MIKWDSVLIKGEKITITVNGIKYYGVHGGTFYWMENHNKSCNAIFGHVDSLIRKKNTKHI